MLVGGNPRLRDRVADNLDFHDMTESESLLIGRDFGVITDIPTAPNGNLYVVSIDQGAVYEIHRARQVPGQANRIAKLNASNVDRIAAGNLAAVVDRVTRGNSALASNLFHAQLTGNAEVPARNTRAHGTLTLRLSSDASELDYQLSVANIRNVVAAHLHLGARGVNGDVVATLFGPAPAGGGRTSGILARGTIRAANLQGPLAGQPFSALVDALVDGEIYVNVHTDDGMGDANTGFWDFAAGEIRGQLRHIGRRSII